MKESLGELHESWDYEHFYDYTLHGLELEHVESGLRVEVTGQHMLSVEMKARAVLRAMLSELGVLG